MDKEIKHFVMQLKRLYRKTILKRIDMEMKIDKEYFSDKGNCYKDDVYKIRAGAFREIKSIIESIF